MALSALARVGLGAVAAFSTKQYAKTYGFSRLSVRVRNDGQPSYGLHCSSHQRSDHLLEKARRIAHQHFDLEELCEDQEFHVQHLLTKGCSGLSIISDDNTTGLSVLIAALSSEGIAIAIGSPTDFIKERSQALLEKGIKVQWIDSSQTTGERRCIYKSARDGELKMLFIPPDRLHRPSFKQLMQELQVSFFAINYSYCQPKWELSFQRQFLQTLRFARKHGVGDVRYLGSPVQSTKPEDLQEGIESEADNTALISSLPEGLHLETCTVRYAEHKWERLQMLLEECKGKVGKVLICADTRAQCIETSHYLGAHNIEARAYHSGVSDTEREETKCWFEESSNGVLCTTIPHGAGIDYTTIQYVIQFHTALQGGEKGFERPGFCAVSIKRVKRII